MFGTIGGLRIWRPVALLLAGAALAATLIGPVAAGNSAASAPAVTMYTRSASCAGYNFLPNDDATRYSYSGTLRYRMLLGSGFGSGFFVCDPGLPNGAVVTKVQFTLRDNDGGYDINLCGLVRSGLTPATATSYQVLAGDFGTSGTPGDVRLTDSSIDFATISNTKYAYWLQCHIQGYGSEIGIYGANVTYRISAANG